MFITNLDQWTNQLLCFSDCVYSDIPTWPCSGRVGREWSWNQGKRSQIICYDTYAFFSYTVFTLLFIVIVKISTVHGRSSSFKSWCTVLVWSLTLREERWQQRRVWNHLCTSAINEKGNVFNQELTVQYHWFYFTDHSLTFSNTLNC